MKMAYACTFGSCEVNALANSLGEILYRDKFASLKMITIDSSDSSLASESMANLVASTVLSPDQQNCECACIICKEQTKSERLFRETIQFQTKIESYFDRFQSCIGVGRWFFLINKWNISTFPTVSNDIITYSCLKPFKSFHNHNNCFKLPIETLIVSIESKVKSIRLDVTLFSLHVSNIPIH